MDRTIVCMLALAGALALATATLAQEDHDTCIEACQEQETLCVEACGEGEDPVECESGCLRVSSECREACSG